MSLHDEKYIGKYTKMSLENRCRNGINQVFGKSMNNKTDFKKIKMLHLYRNLRY